jgi:hypothetical protein
VCNLTVSVIGLKVVMVKILGKVENLVCRILRVFSTVNKIGFDVHVKRGKLFAVGRKYVSFWPTLLESFGGLLMLSGERVLSWVLTRTGVARLSFFLWSPPLRTELLGERVCLHHATTPPDAPTANKI